MAALNDTAYDYIHQFSQVPLVRLASFFCVRAWLLCREKFLLRIPRTDPVEEARNQTPETRRQKPDARNQTPETRRQKPDARNQTPETRRQKPETRNQKPETRNQKPETRRGGRVGGGVERGQRRDVPLAKSAIKPAS